MRMRDATFSQFDELYRLRSMNIQSPSSPTPLWSPTSHPSTTPTHIKSSYPMDESMLTFNTASVMGKQRIHEQVDTTTTPRNFTNRNEHNCNIELLSMSQSIAMQEVDSVLQVDTN